MLPPSRPFLFPLHPPTMAPTLQLATSGAVYRAVHSKKKKEEKKLSATRRNNCVQGTEMVDLYSGSLPPDLICDDIPSFVINKKKVYIYMYLYVERGWTKFNSLGKGVDWKSSLVISLNPPGIESD